jgi:hypothetical protein
MLPRHEASLLARIDQVVRRGWTHIEWYEAYLWYDADRLGKRAWRDIKRKIEDVTDDEQIPQDIQVYEDESGFLLIYARHGEKSYLKSISAFMGRDDGLAAQQPTEV